MKDGLMPNSLTMPMWSPQVRDVLKGILKPCNIFEDGELSIRDNYYRDDTSSADVTPTSGGARPVYQSSPERRRAAHAATYKGALHYSTQPAFAG